MKLRFSHQLMFDILLICQFSLCLANEDPDPNENSKYLNAVRIFADNVLKYGRDIYGKKHTPLFVDGLNTETLDPVVWCNEGEEWILSNFANHQYRKEFFFQLTGEEDHGLFWGDIGSIYYFKCEKCGEKSIESRWDCT